MMRQEESPVRRRRIQVIARAAAILRALEGESDGLSLGQIAPRVGLARSTVQRIVEALCREQLLIAATPLSGVRLGPALSRLGGAASVEFDQIARPAMEELSRAVGETVDLSVLKGSTAVFTDQVQGAHRLRAVSAIGEAFPLHATANGKSMLSVVRQPVLEQLLDRALAASTARTITDRAHLLREIAECRRTGVAYDLEEHTEGISAIGTAFTDPRGRVIALSIPVPAVRFERIRARLAQRILQARKKILDALFEV
jgi:DNA-binding IclR family transcriptional regulator